MNNQPTRLTLQAARDALLPARGLCQAGLQACPDDAEYEAIDSLLTALFEKVDHAYDVACRVSFHHSQQNQSEQTLSELQSAINALLNAMGLCKAGETCCGGTIENEGLECIFISVGRQASAANEVVHDVLFQVRDAQELLDKKLNDFNTALSRHQAEQSATPPTGPALKINNHQYVPIVMPDLTVPQLNIPQRAQRHRPLLEAIAPQCAVVTLHDIDPETGYQYLDLLSPTPKRGNKPREALIGNSVLTVAPSIGEPRYEAIQRALETRQCQPYNYTYDDPKGLHWAFNVTVAPLLDANGKPTEVLTIVHDAEPWQRAYWLDQEERPTKQ